MAAPTRPPPPDAATPFLREGGAPNPPVAARLVPVGARSTPAAVRLGASPCVVGSGPGAHLLVHEPSVSRAHAEFTAVAAGVRVRDLGSTNGTFYLGQRVGTLDLALGSRVTLGAVTLAVEADAEALGALAPFDGEAYRGMIGRAATMRRLFAVLRRLEGSLVTVLVTGASGSGKEVVARALHAGSRVADGPFLAVNCGAIPRDLVASELFGHRKGAFTGATDHRRGVFELAHGGTLFLDEVGELPLALQPTLLRALETGELWPVGAEAPRSVAVRLVAATNVDLEARVAAGAFREDLFYRLAVVRLRLPSLAERAEDVEPLALAFAAEVGLDALPPPLLARWRSSPWPGNVRQLRNAVHAFAALGLAADDGPAPGAGLDAALRAFLDERPYAEQKQELIDRFTRPYLEALLARAEGNRTAAARLAGLDRAYLVRLLERYGVG
jgi:DNA-binding NtrC family response regulator